MAKAKQQYFIIKAEDIPDNISIQSVKEYIESAIQEKKENIQDPRRDIGFGKAKAISWKTMQKVFNAKGPYVEKELHNGK